MKTWRYSGDPLEAFEQDDLAFRRKRVDGQILGYVLWVCHVRGQVVVYKESDIAKQPNQIANYGIRVNSMAEALEIFPQLASIYDLRLGYGCPTRIIA